MAVTGATAIRRHLNALQEEMKKREPPPPAAGEALVRFAALFAPVEKDLVPGDIMGLTASWETALRGGAPSMLLVTMAASVIGFPASPTETEKSLYNDISITMTSSMDKLNEIIRNEIPKLNEILAAASLAAFPKLQETTF